MPIGHGVSTVDWEPVQYFPAEQAWQESESTRKATVAAKRPAGQAFVQPEIHGTVRVDVVPPCVIALESRPMPASEAYVPGAHCRKLISMLPEYGLNK